MREEMKIIFLLQNIHNIVLASHNGSGKENKKAKYGLHEMHFLGANNCFWEKKKQSKKSQWINRIRGYIIKNRPGLRHRYGIAFFPCFS